MTAACCVDACRACVGVAACLPGRLTSDRLSRWHDEIYNESLTSNKVSTSTLPQIREYTMASAVTISAGLDARAAFKKSLPSLTLAAFEYDESQYVDDLQSEDSFYSLPEKAASAAPGTLLKIERETSTSMYNLPPATALSRFIFQSENLNGAAVPVSAFVLWPYSPRSQSEGFAIVAWAHGTTGSSSNCAPSRMKNLWQHFLAPYQLALHGYVVVAADYAGLGLGKDAAGKPIIHEYLASPAQANDVIYSVQAARAAFPELSKQFVVMGHSQGGGAAWTAAQR
jgi:hypothetical protein